MCQPGNHNFDAACERQETDSAVWQLYFCRRCLATVWIPLIDHSGQLIDFVPGDSVGEPDRYANLPEQAERESIESHREQRKLHLLDCAVRTAARATQYLQAADVPLALLQANAEEAARIVAEGSGLELLPDDGLIGLVQVRAAVLQRIRQLQSQGQE